MTIHKSLNASLLRDRHPKMQMVYSRKLEESDVINLSYLHSNKTIVTQNLANKNKQAVKSNINIIS